MSSLLAISFNVTRPCPGALLLPNYHAFSFFQFSSSWPVSGGKLNCRIQQNKSTHFFKFIQQYNRSAKQMGSLCDHCCVHQSSLQTELRLDFQPIPSFTCLVCQELTPLIQLYPLDCSHLIHRQCFIQYFTAQLPLNNLAFTCFQCSASLSIRHLQEIVPVQCMNKYYEFSLGDLIQRDSTLSWCPTPACPAIFQFSPVSLSAIYVQLSANNSQMFANRPQLYECPACFKKYCIKCRQQTHGDRPCSENREDEEFQRVAKRANYRRCPNCRFWVEKSEGCDHMICRCQFEFCFKCCTQYGLCDCSEEDQISWPEEDQQILVIHEQEENSHSNSQSQQEVISMASISVLTI